MKKSSLIFMGLFIAGCFLLVFSFALGVIRKTDQEIEKIHTSSEAVIGKYFNPGTTPAVTFPSNPLFFDNNECIVLCYVVQADDPKAKQRIEFDIFLERNNQVWRANIIKVKRRPYIPPETKLAPWDYFWKSTPRNHQSK